MGRTKGHELDVVSGSTYRFAAVVFAFGCARAEGQRPFPASAASAPAVTSITVAHYSIEIPVGYEAKDVSHR